MSKNGRKEKEREKLALIVDNNHREINWNNNEQKNMK